jgi:hypothetical protein
MPESDRNRLIRVLAHFDQLLAESEAIAADTEDECQQSAIDFMIEFQDARRRVEAKLRGE